MKTFKQFVTEISHTDRTIRRELVAKGYKFLGAGVDQEAYLEPGTGKVLKVFGTQKQRHLVDRNGFSEDQKMFKRFHAYCEARPTNPFLPKFDGWESFEMHGNKYLQIRMERLQHLPASSFYLYSDLVAGAANGPWDTFAEYLDHHDNHTFPKRVTRDDHLAREIVKVDDHLAQLILLIGEDGCALLFKTIQELSNLADKYSYEFDLHYRNFLNRNDGTPVIVDPWTT